MKDNGDGTYDASYTVPDGGKYTVNVSLNGVPVGDGDYPVVVMDAVPENSYAKVINLVFFFHYGIICTLRSICNCVSIIVCVCNHRILKKVIEGSAYRSFERGRRGVLPSSLISTLHPKSLFFKSFALFSLHLISLIVV